MVDAPERIYADRGPKGGWMYRDDKMPDTQHVYVRADIAERQLADMTKDRDHWKEYSSNQKKLVESGVFVSNDEYARLWADRRQLADMRELFAKDGAQHASVIRDLTERHEARINKYLKRVDELTRQLAERDADLALKDAALKPFADVCGYFDGQVKDDDDISIALRSIKAHHVRTARAAIAGSGDGWREITDEERPPHDTPVLLWQPPSMSHPNGLIEARPFSTGRSGKGWSEYSQHSWATHWMPLPASPSTAGER